MDKNLVGKRSEKILNTIERGAVKKFAEAIGDKHPIYVSREYGSNTRYGENIAPPTFPIILNYGTIEKLDLMAPGLIHGEQQFHYNRPLIVGEEVYCWTEVEDYYEKTGGSGKMGFLTVNEIGASLSGETIFTSKQVLIITEAVRKAMS